MKKLVLFSLMSIAAFAANSSPIMHANTLIFEGTGGSIVYFVVGATNFVLAPASPAPDRDTQSYEPYSVYPMNSWGGTEWAWTKDFTSTLTVHAPRKKNAKVARWASQQQRAVLNGRNSHVYATVSGGSLASAPDDLNFAFIGDLYLDTYEGNYRCPNVIIGQGNTATINNWWIYTNFWPSNKDGTPAKSGHKNRLECIRYYRGLETRKQFSISRTTKSNKFVISRID
ncbi:hypothetical protein E3226_006240 [Legionella geestiana]|uniref:hypothetical protein n=1 Tax=Legionella geestiana TaxID=45065 RepID=UPI001092F055|nr:hypothetical protein [Legionella geestiana]QDQ40026.1 hypothetical protein E3226_006240 [Legionella geestiana]